jgi:MSHA biogenesis protein MshG
MPILGSIFERTILARFTYSLSTVLKSGVPMTTALSLVAEAVDNAYMRRKILAMRVDIESGITLYRAAANAKLFTPLVLQMIAVGDESGRVAELLEDVGDYYEREVDYDLGALTAKIEPVLIVIVAGMVLVMGLGIFEPMWNLNDAMQT